MGINRLLPPSPLRLLFLLGALWAAPAVAGVESWTPFGPGSGVVRDLEVDPVSPQTVWAAVRFAVYKSENAGVSWTRRLNGRGFQFEEVAVSPGNPQTVFAGGDRLLRSTDGGATWTLLPGLSAYHLKVAGEGPGPATVYAGNYNELFKSSDDGTTWTSVFRGPGTIFALAVDPEHPGTVYLAHQESLRKSVDGGATWQEHAFPASPSPYGAVMVLGLAPSRPETLYAANNRSFFRSVDGGLTWTRTELPGLGVYPGPLALTVDPVTPSTVYLADAYRVAVSHDGGETWQWADAGLAGSATSPGQIEALAIDPTRPQSLYAGTWTGVAWSQDGGDHWWRFGVQAGLWDGWFSTVRLHPTQPGRIYAFVAGAAGRTYVTRDGGQSWVRFARSLADRELFDLAFDPAAPDSILYVADRDAVLRSADGGVTWTPVADWGALRLATPGKGQLLAARFNCGLRRTTDGGRRWREVLPCQVTLPVAGVPTPARLQVTRLVVEPKNPARVYAIALLAWGSQSSSTTRLYTSRDGGATWREGIGASTVAVDPSRPGTVYAIDLEGWLMRSTNGGRRWTRLAQDVHNVVVDPRNPQILYGANRFTVLRSTNGGISWDKATPEFPDYPFNSVQELLADPLVPGRFYVVPGLGALLEATFPTG